MVTGMEYNYWDLMPNLDKMLVVLNIKNGIEHQIRHAMHGYWNGI